MTIYENRAISDWLAHADPAPDRVRAEWAYRGIALLPLGRRFDAVRVPARRVHAAVGSDEPRTVAAALADWMQGPVIRDTRGDGQAYYVLVAPCADWDGAEERLGTGAYLGVPRLGGPSMLAAWVVPPPHPGGLCDPAHLRALLSTADALRRVEP